jgi:hypothetical protein
VTDTLPEDSRNYSATPWVPQGAILTLKLAARVVAGRKRRVELGGVFV